MPQSELEELAKNITIAVTKRWGKTDPCFEESWRSVLRDAADTIGLEITVAEPEVLNNKENDRLKAKLDEVSKREQIKDMELAQLRAKVNDIINIIIFFYVYFVGHCPRNWIVYISKLSQR